VKGKKVYRGERFNKPLIYGADFETDRDGSESFICQWALSPLTTSLDDARNGKIPFAWTGRDLEGFEFAVRSQMHKWGHILVYFHNLRYDQSYFFPMMEHFREQGWREFFIVKEGHPIIISYQWFEEGDQYPRMSVSFRDSMQKLTNKLKDIGEMLGVGKLMPPDGDFHEGWSKDIDYSNMKYDQPDWRYVATDAYICGMAMMVLHEQGYDKATCSSDALQACKRAVNEGHKNPKKGATYWDTLFPPLPVVINREGISQMQYAELVGDSLVDDLTIREAYWGGINASHHRGVHVAGPGKSIYHVDYHSMYPSQMKYRPMPYGKCCRIVRNVLGPLKPGRDYDPETECYIMQTRISKMKVRPDRIPWYHLKNPEDRRIEGLKSSDAVREIHHTITVTCSDVELWDLIDYYDIEFTDEPDPDYGRRWGTMAWIFKTHVGDLAPHVDTCYALKQKEDDEGRKGGLMYNWDKKLMNAVYGKMSQHPKLSDVEMVWDEDIQWWRWKEIGDHVSETFESYIPYGVFITAWARHQLLQAWKAVGCENVLHSDTDSVVFIGDSMPEGLEITPSTLDTWGNEVPLDGDIAKSGIVRFYEYGVKRYVEITHWPIRSLKDVNMAMAGVPQNSYKMTDRDGNTVKVPVGMWVEILDDPDRFLTESDESVVLGQTDYRLRSKWLRDLYESVGLDPDHVNTMKNVTHMGQGGIQIDQSTFEFKDNYALRIR
jgi:hypothetical protein